MGKLIDTEQLKWWMAMKPSQWNTPDERWLPERDIGKYIDTCPEMTTACGYLLSDLAVLARACAEQGITKTELRGFVNDVAKATETAYKIIQREMAKNWEEQK